MATFTQNHQPVVVGGRKTPTKQRSTQSKSLQTSPQRGAKNQYPSQELLDDLCSRFVLNVPVEELQSFERILFLIEQAHWFYEDNTREEDPCLKSFNLREFSALMFQKCASLRPYIGQVDNIYKDFTSYKFQVPTTGAIILNETCDKCLLVKGWKSGASWGFPKGKKNKDEEDDKCAIREVLEETSLDISSILKPQDYLELLVGQQRSRLFIVFGVPENSHCEPQTKKEISEIAWHPLDDIPILGPTGEGVVFNQTRGASGAKYFLVHPFLGQLKSWIKSHNLKASTISQPGIVTVWKANILPPPPPPPPSEISSTLPPSSASTSLLASLLGKPTSQILPSGMPGLLAKPGVPILPPLLVSPPPPPPPFTTSSSLPSPSSSLPPPPPSSLPIFWQPEITENGSPGKCFREFQFDIEHILSGLQFHPP